MQTRLLATTTAAELGFAVEEAARLLAAGEPVALPTETVYGLTADALSPDAAARIFEAKERPSFDPLICHLPDEGWLKRMANIPDASRELVAKLTARFWPGPLTLVLPKSDIVPDLVTSGLPTVAVRMSAHPVFDAVVKRFGKPLAAPSANRFGRISPTAAAHVIAELDGRIPLVLDGGPTSHGIESTIVAVEGDSMRILRSGPVTREELAELGPIIETQRTGLSNPEAPGQLASHYAPRTRMIFADQNSPLPLGRIGFLAWRNQPTQIFTDIEVLSPNGDLREAATTLFAKMRRLDEAGLDCIVAEAVPQLGLGVAIMDRLRKACGLGNFQA